MLARYLGSKQAILDELLGTVAQRCPPGSHVVDAFSGSLAVSLGLKKNGYRVTSNDVNLFSYVLANAYLVPSSIPYYDLQALIPAPRVGEYVERARSIVEGLAGTAGFSFLEDATQRKRYETLLAVLEHLTNMQLEDLPKSARHSHFFDTYCEDGRNSAYVSLRGTQGRRRI